MRKKYRYNRANVGVKGFSALASVALIIALIVFAGLITIYYLPFLKGLIDFTELEYALKKIYLRVDAFLLIGLGLSFFGSLLSLGTVGAIRREKGGFRGFILMLISAVLIVFFVLTMTKGMKYGIILKCSFIGILIVGILTFLLGIETVLTRIYARRKMARSARRFERNYLKYEKYNK